MKQKQQNNRTETQRNFLLSFFNPDDRYTEKQINDFWLIKQFSKFLNNWCVAIYTNESYLKRKNHNINFCKSCFDKPRGNSGSEDK